MIRTRRLALALFLSIAAPSGAAVAADAADGWHAVTDSYQVYFGVVPAQYIAKRPKVVDGDKAMHGGISNRDPSARHVMVTIFDRETGDRVIGATVIAQVWPKGDASEVQARPLEKMVTSGKVAYGNFFTTDQAAPYSAEVAIYEGDKDGNETAEFTFGGE